MEYKAYGVVINLDSGDKARFEKREKVRAGRKLKHSLPSMKKRLACVQWG